MTLALLCFILGGHALVVSMAAVTHHRNQQQHTAALNRIADRLARLAQ
jgi:hypothetical protein